MRLLDTIKLDIKINSCSRKATIAVVLFRVAHSVKTRKSLLARLLGLPVLAIYQLLIVWLWDIDIPSETEIGVGFNLAHGSKVVINGATKLGNHVLVRQGTTVGNKSAHINDSPVIGNHVNIGANCVITGGISIGNNVTIGAGTVVTKSIPSNSIAYGNPLKIVGKTIIGKVNPTNFKRIQLVEKQGEMLNNGLYTSA
ncbi:serine acetyltransferase [Mucilaginibacter achroorhodeus]|uniref:Serine acetyltransferase n=1 Tax=Mucilaginibacter achroorhodeus TaxID=2599294 RepID=A0A563U6M1_9SPHI|nr:DapH/DapD/GlmU-related protein [Mucilaginibacter achroorhodeus]TWR27006.1 serine acetyltransferase [Mucilaginibacter achroorhodeus]